VSQRIYYGSNEYDRMNVIVDFRTIHVKPRNVNIQNRAILNDINYRYDRKMHEQGVDFRIEDPTSILFFY